MTITLLWRACMTRLDFRMVLAVVFLATAAGCKGDPTGDLRGGPAILSLNPTLIFIDDGDSRGFEVVVRDEQLNPVAASVTATSTNPAVFTIRPDTTVPSADNARHNFIVDAIATGQARIVVSGGGIEDTATVSVLPLVFPGVAVGSPVVGQEFKVAITDPLFSFDADEANIDFGAGVMGEVISVTAETLTVRVPQPDAAQPAVVEVHGVAVSYVMGLVVTLPTATPLNVVPVGDRETLGAVTITIPADGAADLVFYDGFKSGEPIDYFYQFTLAAPDTLTFTVEWVGDSDVDMLNCNAACSAFVGGFGAATGANPETYTVIFSAAGTFNLLIEQFDDHDDPAHLFKVTIHNP